MPADLGRARLRDTALPDAGVLLQRYADEVCRHHPVPGGTLVVVDRGGELLRVGFGVADLADGRAPGPADLFEVGSISKSFTALAVLCLAEEGRVDLDGPVARWLPWLDLGPWTAQVTLWHLLSHTAGLVMGGEGLPDATASAWTLRQRASRPPGERFHYSNHGYVVLGLVVAAVEGRPLAEVVHDRVLQPLGIAADAIARVTYADLGRLATGYTRAYDDLPWVPGDPLAPAARVAMDGGDGSVALSTTGLAAYLRLLLSDGTVDGRRVLPAGVLARLATPSAPTGEDVLAPAGTLPVGSSRYALGLNTEVVAGHDCLTHGGGNLGYASFLLVDTTLGVGIGVLTNADGDCLAAQLLARVAHRVLRAVADGSALPSPAELPRVDLRVRPGELAPVLLGRFTPAGDDAGAEVQVEEAADGVLVRCGDSTGRLWSTLDGRYVTDNPSLRRFHLDAGESGWSYGPDLLLAPGSPAPTGAGAPGDLAPPDAAAYVGHYRSWTPWFPCFRIVLRAGRLLLTAPGGVEAPGAEEVLVPLGEGTWRIGTDPWLPERLVEVARVDDRVVVLDRDGALYSRTFTP